VSLRPTGTAPERVWRADLLPIERGVAMPAKLGRYVVRDTLIAMRPGDSIKRSGAQLSNLYQWAQRLRIRLRVKRLSGTDRAKDAVYRVWRST
jgi:hypothetical protein